MKQLKILFSMFLAAAAMLLAGIHAGCSSPERTAYVAFGSAGSTANAAIGAYNEYRKTHDVPKEQVLKVRGLVQAYVNAVETARTARNALEVAKASGDNGKEADATMKAELAIRALEASSADLITLINSIVPLTQK